MPQKHTDIVSSIQGAVPRSSLAGGSGGAGVQLEWMGRNWDMIFL